MVWFLAPTKVLCSQQLAYLSKHMPAVSMRALTGDDGVDCWSNQAIWNRVLQGMKVVISTHAVLADALTHGFIQLPQLALIVFDEAHHCMKSHPGNRIMRDFYHKVKGEHATVPSILGLTAAVDVAKIGGTKFEANDFLRQLEQNLDATCRTPLIHQQELTAHVPQRSFTKITYTQNFDGSVNPPLYLHKLEKIVKTLHENGERDRHAIPSSLSKLPAKARAIWCQLGTWALQYYINMNLSHFSSHFAMNENFSSERPPDQELTALMALLRSELEGHVAHLHVPGNISDKVERLMSFLKEKSRPDFSGIIFVRERVTAYVLSALLNTHPLTQNGYRCAPCVSSTAHSESWAKHDTLPFEKLETLVSQFRSGLTNLIIATSVLEEGIDIPACHLVISFDSPDNIISFTQRQGRARQYVSEFAAMEAKEAGSTFVTSTLWNDLEKQLQSICLDYERSAQIVEVGDEHSEEILPRFRIHTGFESFCLTTPVWLTLTKANFLRRALLTSENAIPHLYHFCTTLRSGRPGENHPAFSYEKNVSELTRSTVYMPSGIDRSLRVVKGHHWWKTERAARQDAAFQAVVALHRQGLINDHLLPLFSDNAGVEAVYDSEVLSQLPTCSNLHKFWKEIPGPWMERTMYKCRIDFVENGENRPELSMALFTPVKLPLTADLNLYLDAKTTFTTILQPLNIEMALTPSTRVLLKKITTLFIKSTRVRPLQGHYPEFLPFFTPDLPMQELEEWLLVNHGSFVIRTGQTKIPILFPSGLIRSPSLHFAPHTFVRWVRDPATKELSIICQKFRRRKNLLWQASSSSGLSFESGGPKTACVAATDCIIDFLPWELSLASLAIPHIIQLLHQYLMAHDLRIKIFNDLPMINSSLLMEAITTPASQWPINYQQLEFFGDSILKLVVVMHVFYKYPLWHEGYLSKFKDLLVSNERLTRAAVHAHLERFICADFVTWKHPIFSPIMDQDQTQNRTLPRKAFADVLEALTAAAYECGGITLSQQLLGIFIPEIADISSAPQSAQKDYDAFSAHLNQKIDLLLAFKFKNRALIWEALTHPSWQRDSSTGSYQRLEFLGDAVLDFLVSKNLYKRCPKLAEGRMSELRAALVNADFLAFLCMELTLLEPCCHSSTSRSDLSELTTQTKVISLWTFMRHDAPDLIKIQALCNTRYQLLGDKIKRNLVNHVPYPWAMLAQLGPSKFYSDLVESTIGAIFVDSGECLDTCERFLERLGLLDYLERFVGQEKHLEHPISTLHRMSGTQTPDLQSQEMDNGLHRASVWLRSERIASVENCSTKSQAIVMAADAAIIFLSNA
ncbi:ATP-dependent helicase dcl2 [Penicillium subrubescens]|uniref:ATP-dependent helicase dcl2 n=1 Tax=Penicillium subrubescens TaxID=1316194 RepID=UPI0025457A35|nr:ATP-dependent helicase dcl2 [Penicillium subrubescens]KAJ5873617.1 ATP-dependent helicase dcl2 [Penicillium subrubescens]